MHVCIDAEEVRVARKYTYYIKIYNTVNAYIDWERSVADE